MWFEIIYYLGNSLSSEDSSMDEGILIVFDRNFIKDKTFNGRIQPDKRENKTASIILWDRYFPKPLCYMIKTENHEKDELITLIKNESDPGNKFFKVCEDLKNETIKIKESDNMNDEFKYIIFCKEDNFTSIRKSLDYILIVEILWPLYEKLLIKLCIYVYKIRRLQALAENETEYSSLFKNIRDAEIHLIELINTIARRLALIRIPSRYDPKLLISFDEIEDKLDITLKFLLKTLLEMEKVLNTKKILSIDESKICKLKYVLIEHKGYIKREMIKNRFSIICNEIIVSFKGFKDLKFEFKAINGTNAEIILEYDSEKIKCFIDKYFNLLYKYCEVMENIDEMHLTIYCFHISESGYPCEKILEDIYMDKLVARELKTYLLDFSLDMTDFMIFSQTDYFKKEFPKRILTNLDYLTDANKQKDLFSSGLILGDYNLVDFYNLWSAILYDPHKEIILSMEDLIKNMNDKENKTIRNVGSFLRKYLFIIFAVVVFVLTVLFIRLQRPRNFMN